MRRMPYPREDLDQLKPSSLSLEVREAEKRINENGGTAKFLSTFFPQELKDYFTQKGYTVEKVNFGIFISVTALKDPPKSENPGE